MDDKTQVSISVDNSDDNKTQVSITGDNSDIGSNTEVSISRDSPDSPTKTKVSVSWDNGTKSKKSNKSETTSDMSDDKSIKSENRSNRMENKSNMMENKSNMMENKSNMSESDSDMSDDSSDTAVRTEYSMLRLSASDKEPRVFHVRAIDGKPDYSGLWLGREYHGSKFTIRAPGIETQVTFILTWCCETIAGGALPTNEPLARLSVTQCGAAGPALLFQFNETIDPTGEKDVPQDLDNDDWEEFHPTMKWLVTAIQTNKAEELYGVGFSMKSHCPASEVHDEDSN